DAYIDVPQGDARRIDHLAGDGAWLLLGGDPERQKRECAEGCDDATNWKYHALLPLTVYGGSFDRPLRARQPARAGTPTHRPTHGLARLNYDRLHRRTLVIPASR